MIELDGKRYHIRVDEYDGGNTAVSLVDAEGEYAGTVYGRLSINVISLAAGCFVLNHDLTRLRDALVATGCFDDTGMTVDYNRVRGQPVLALTRAGYVEAVRSAMARQPYAAITDDGLAVMDIATLRLFLADFRRIRGE